MASPGGRKCDSSTDEAFVVAVQSEGLSPKALLAESVTGPAPCITNSYKSLAVANSLIVSIRDFMMK